MVISRWEHLMAERDLILKRQAYLRDHPEEVTELDTAALLADLTDIEAELDGLSHMEDYDNNLGR